MNQFGPTLEGLIASGEMTKKSLAEKAEIDPTTLTRICQGKLDPTPKVLRALCENVNQNPAVSASLVIARMEDIIESSGLSASLFHVSQANENPTNFDGVPPAILKVASQLAQLSTKNVEFFELMKASVALADTTEEPDIDDEIEVEVNEPIQMTKPEQWHTLPCYGVAAGSPISGDEFDAEFKFDYSKDHFAVKVFGNSMEPMIDDGQIVIVRTLESLNNPNVKKGEIYCFQVKGERTLKRYNTRPATQEEIDTGLSYTSPRGTQRVKILESINPDYPEIVLREGDEMLGWYDPVNQPNSNKIESRSQSPMLGDPLPAPKGPPSPYEGWILPGESIETFNIRFRKEWENKHFELASVIAVHPSFVKRELESNMPINQEMLRNPSQWARHEGKEHIPGFGLKRWTLFRESVESAENEAETKSAQARRA
ncbi:MAG: LexA family transcriptional regulator [Verrucomicrobiota bacterium]